MSSIVDQENCRVLPTSDIAGKFEQFHRYPKKIIRLAISEGKSREKDPKRK